MIRLFTSTETNFNHNQWVLSECTNAIVTENVEGIFDLDLEYPLIDSKGLSQYLIKSNIIKCPISTTDTRGEQLFVIRTRTQNTNTKRIQIYAQCIARADLGERNFILGVTIPTGTTRKQAVQLLLNGCVEQKGETVGTLDTNTNTSINLGLDKDTGLVINYLDIAYVKPLEGLLGDAQSIQYAYGGEIVYNNREINFVDERGSNHSFEIRSGKNLQELQQEISDMDSDNFATALIMCSSDGIYLPNNEIIYSPNATTLGKYYKRIVCDDVTAINDTQTAIDVVYAQLREKAQKQFDNGIDKLPINNTINFIQLANTEEYKNYSILEKCEIGNNVTVNHEKANITATGRVIEIKFNPLWNQGKGRIEQVTIGDRKKKSIVNTINDTNTKVDIIDDKTNENTENIKNVRKTTEDLEVVMEARDNAIELSVTNLATDTTTKFSIQDGQISQRVTNSEFGSYKIQTADLISQRVEKGELSTLIEQSEDEVAIAIKGKTNSDIIFSSSGQTIKNGALAIQDSSGYIVLYFGVDGSTIVDDLEVKDTSVDSDFYRTLQNMDEVNFMGVLRSSEAYFGNGNDVYIDGEPLRSYIDGRIDLKL